MISGQDPPRPPWKQAFWSVMFTFRSSLGGGVGGQTVTNQTVSQMGQEAGGPGKSASHFCIANKYHADPPPSTQDCWEEQEITCVRMCMCVYVC